MEELYNQLFCLLMFTLTGITIGILFDIFRILRKSFKTADIITYLQDILFWIFAGLIVLFAIFKFNNGEIRSYLFVGIAIGVLLYMLTISKFIVKYCVKLLQWLTKIISYPFCILGKFFKKIIIKPISLLAQKFKIAITKECKKRHRTPKIIQK